jgi:FkbM family methyltransferase
MISKVLKYILLNFISVKNQTRLNHNIMDKRFTDSIGIKKNDLIIDVGSHLGESIDRFLKIKKNIIIHSFEPNNECYQKISKKYHKFSNIRVNNLALGSKKSTKTFYINNNSQTSSFYKINKKFKFENEKFKTIKKKKIAIEKLDNYCNKNKIKKINFLKLDCQGWEKEILFGAKNLLKKKCIKKIQIEITLCDHYEKKFNFFEFEKILLKYGFSLVNITNPTWDNNAKKILWLDALYSLRNNK